MQNIGGPIILVITLLATLLIILAMICFVLQKTNNKYQSIDKLIERGERVAKDPSASLGDVHRESEGAVSQTNLDYVGNILHQIHQRNL